MSIFDRFRKKAAPAVPPSEKPRELPPRPPKKSERDLATERGEPYVAIVSLEVDPENLHQGAFELDWNDKFISNLIRAGYKMRADDSDADIVDRWFQNICRHVVMETWEQEQAMNPQRPIQSRDLGGGRREMS